MSLASELRAAHKARRRRLGLEYQAAGFGYVRPRYVVLEGDGKDSGEAWDGSGCVVEHGPAPVTPTAGPEQLPPGWLVALRSTRYRRLQRLVAEAFGLSAEVLLGTSRRPAHVLPRHVAMYLGCELFGDSTTMVGRGLGGRDHSTVVHGCAKVRRLMASDAGFAARVEGLMAAWREMVG